MDQLNWKSRPDVSKFCWRFWKALFVCLNLSHRLVVEQFCIKNRSIVITKNFFAVNHFWNCLPLKILRGFTLCPLISGRSTGNGRKPRMNDYFLPQWVMESFLIVHSTICWVILEVAGPWKIFFVLKVCDIICKWLSSWRRLFLINDYNSMAVSFEKLNFWRKKRL